MASTGVRHTSKRARDEASSHSESLGQAQQQSNSQHPSKTRKTSDGEQPKRLSSSHDTGSGSHGAGPGGNQGTSPYKRADWSFLKWPVTGDISDLHQSRLVTCRKYNALLKYVRGFQIKDKRLLFSVMRKKEGADAGYLLPRYGITTGEFSVCQVLNEGRKNTD